MIWLVQLVLLRASQVSDIPVSTYVKSNSGWVSECSWTSHSTHNRSFHRQVAGHCTDTWQPNFNTTNNVNTQLYLVNKKCKTWTKQTTPEPELITTGNSSKLAWTAWWQQQHFPNTRVLSTSYIYSTRHTTAFYKLSNLMWKIVNTWEWKFSCTCWSGKYSNGAISQCSKHVTFNMTATHNIVVTN